MQELFSTDSLHYDVRLQLCCRDKAFGSFSHLFSPFDFRHFSVFYGILSKFIPFFLIWYPDFICYFPFTSNGISIIKTKCN